MIQINVQTNTAGGLIIPTGALLNVNPQFIDYIEDGLTKYDVAFTANMYGAMAKYLSQEVLTRDTVEEYDINYIAKDVDIQTLSSVNALLDLFRTAIESGSEGFIGVGTGKTALVYPPTV